ncbi:flavin reductase family protein [Oleisolibacter albus]|uniref:flavin reductase family protein n=1 Tax=Oleisolibacter albus TaxID=2171757 RepID=UPI000DF24DC6|nr:flavin reductase family protein [Oleisolibacter albus]
MSLDARAFRDALGCFATGVCVATTRTVDGRPLGVTVNSVASVSLDPPLVLFCLDREAESLAAFSQAPGFALTMLAEEQKPLSRAFAGGPPDERWAGVDPQYWETGAPVIPGGLASLDCIRHAMHDGGDHVILVGRVVRLWSRSDGRPLLYFRGGYNKLA